MGINYILKKEGLEEIEKLDTMHINTIAKNISEKLCNSFPELHLDQSDLFVSISRLDMYTAKMPDNNASAKYVYNKNEIYFNKNLDLNDIDTLAIHECIHCLQELYDTKGRLVRLGLYDLNSKVGLALNEAATQLMASVATKSDVDSATYYGITINSISPIYYPLECAILNQMMYFTGTYPLYHSTLLSNDIFQNTFSSMSSKEVYFEISKRLDKLLDVETEISNLSYKISTFEGNEEKLKYLKKQAENKKLYIQKLFLSIQDLIIDKCFTKMFNEINSFNDIREFQNMLYNFKDLVVTTPDYTYYNNFYCNIMKDVAFKRDQLIKYGSIIDINIPKQSLALVPIKTTTSKLGKLKELINTVTSFIFGD